jgi:hypothetical protein
MISFLSRWARATFDYNPTFPLSAVLLMAGMKKLVHEGALDAGNAGTTLAGVSILQGYELALLGVALLALWPRRIVYETTAVLIIFGFARFAAPFVVIGFAVEGHPVEAALAGALLAVLMAFKNEALARWIVPMSRGERLYDGALFAIGAAGFPLLAYGLARGTGGEFSYDTARLLELAAWWVLALVLAPIARLVPDLAASSPLHVPGPTAVLRAWLTRRTGLALVGLPFLLLSSLWLGGNGSELFFFLPLALVVLATIASVARAAGVAMPPALAHAPAALALFVLAAPRDLLLGRVPVLSQASALLVFLPVAAGALPLLVPGEARRGLRSLALVAGVAPLRLVPGWVEGELYLLGLASLFVAVGLVRRSDRLVAQGIAASAALAVHLASWGPHGAEGPGTVATASQLALALATALALLVAWRVPVSRLAAPLVLSIASFALVFEVVRGVPADPTVLLGLAACGAAAVLGRRQGRASIARVAGAGAVALLGRRFGSGIDPGLGLVLLAFGSIGAGTAIALRRERLERERVAA